MRDRAEPVSVLEGQRRVLEAVRSLPAETIAAARACGRVLAEDTRSRLDLPPRPSA